jgi:hypothetical protein
MSEGRTGKEKQGFEGEGATHQLSEILLIISLVYILLISIYIFYNTSDGQGSKRGFQRKGRHVVAKSFQAVLIICETRTHTSVFRPP